MNKLKRLWVNLISSLWFVPGLIVLRSIAVAFALIEVDSRISREMLIEVSGLVRLRESQVSFVQAQAVHL